MPRQLEMIFSRRCLSPIAMDNLQGGYATDSILYSTYPDSILSMHVYRLHTDCIQLSLWRKIKCLAKYAAMYILYMYSDFQLDKSFMLKYYCNGLTKIYYLHKHLRTHEYFHTRKFPDLW